MGRWKGKGSLFPPSHHPTHFPSPRFARVNINRSLRDDWGHFLVSREPSDEVLDSKGCVFIRQIEVCKRLCFLLAKLARPWYDVSATAVRQFQTSYKVQPLSNRKQNIEITIVIIIIIINSLNTKLLNLLSKYFNTFLPYKLSLTGL